MLLKKKAYMKSYDGQTKWMYFLMMTDSKNIILFGKKSAQMLKKKFDNKPIQNINFLKTKTKFYSDKAKDFHYPF